MPQANYSQQLSQQLQISTQQIDGVLRLLEDGGTVPFIARYRKEMTGSLDEVAISAIRDGHQKIVDLEKRRSSIIEGLEKNNQLTPALGEKLQQATSLSILEDIYLPFRPKRKTRGLLARQRGLEPLAKHIETNKSRSIDLAAFLNEEQGVTTDQDALKGALDIIAEEIAENAVTRGMLRNVFASQSIITSNLVKKNEAQGDKFKDYFSWQEPAAKSAGHRLLAMFRGENEEVLKLTIRPPQDVALRVLKKQHLTSGPWQQEILAAIEDSYTRLLAPSLETELKNNLKNRADDEAIEVFGENLRQLLLSPPLGAKRVLAIDPGYRTGCKVVCLDAQGGLLEYTTIFPSQSQKQKEQAATIIGQLVRQHQIEAIAIGNGTAGRETEEFIQSLQLSPTPIITLVNEDGASIYSASAVARSEFPDHDITVRGSVSIGRRLQDPLAELVKIEPKSIGVGQYQHDVNQAELKRRLDDIVLICVNSVGVELNSASIELLTHVAGLGRTLAENIVTYRNSITAFTSRKELLKVPRLGPKAFEQCAGFLRIHNGINPLDASGVHPERYSLVTRMAKDIGVTIKDLLENENARSKINPDRYTDSTTGLETIEDILTELAKPGRDPRSSFEHFSFQEGIRSMEDLQEGMRLPAIITNITKFGAFADIGIKQDGLIHISQLADKYVKDPAEVVHLGQKVMVRVLEIDDKRKRIALSLKK
ncbi:Tex family protein [Desulforhopalus sp. IMCC35007]|uniref:Tex family protein n=1 Tax=Desulforhopalus sp. IMCC35007 TaxID=2569543 RepID=UPI0010AECEF3|nr:Tex family protein [Desulforhopalus sp. IMCC35007]TKB06523.1 RNA-binding transcriptional accessory protein [Desulforhopalus sp. IMCC35007]